MTVKGRGARTSRCSSTLASQDGPPGRTPDTAALAGPIDRARATLSAADEAWLDAREACVALTAELEWLDGALDTAVADLAREALVIVAGNRADPRFPRLFPINASVAMAARASLRRCSR